MPVLVVAATALELSAALGLKVDAPQGLVFACTAHGRQVLALVTGLSVVNAALSLGSALHGRDVAGVVNFGVAGSFDLAAHPLCSAWLVTEEIWPEYGLQASTACCAEARALGFALSGTGAAAIFERLAWDAAAELERMGLPCANGRAAGIGTAKSLTVSGVTADAARAEGLSERYGAGLENMEGFALAYGARLAHLPFAELRTVSNAVGSRPPQGWDLPGALGALGRAAQQLLGS